MKKLILTLAMLSSTAHAAGGFSWFGALSDKLGAGHGDADHLAHFVHHYGHIFHFSLIAVILILMGLAYRVSLAQAGSNYLVPDKGFTFRNLVELYGKFIQTQCKAVLGEADTPKYFKFVSIIFITIFLSNVLGLIPGFLPPTEIINTTLALGVFSFCYFNIKGCKELGTWNYISHFAGPLLPLAPLIFVIEILSTAIRPISLALRLRGNMMGDHMVLETFLNLEILGIPMAYILVPIPFYLLGLLVCFIQAYVFTMLSMVYISLATAHHDHDEHH